MPRDDVWAHLQTDLRLAGVRAVTGVDALGTDILRRLREPHRRYHDVTHVLEVRAALEVLGRASAATMLAAWLHDVVYDPRAAPGANEAASARYAKRWLRELGTASAVVADVVSIIEATTLHVAHDTSPDLAAFLDADLWILASPRARFDAYCAQVREEYAFVGDTAYAAARSHILTEFVSRPRVYATEAARVWEAPARANIAIELSAQSSR